MARTARRHVRARGRRTHRSPCGRSRGRSGGAAATHCGARGAGLSEGLRPEYAVRAEGHGGHLDAERGRLRRRRPLPRLRRPRLQPRVSRVHGGRAGGVRRERPFLRPREGQRRREGAPRGAHRPPSSAGTGARQRPVPDLQPDGRAARDPVSRPGRIPRSQGPNPAALRVGLRAAHDLDGRPAPAEAGRDRSAALVGLCGRPLGRQHARRHVHGPRQSDLDRLLRLSAQRSDGARGALYADQLRHDRAQDGAHRSRVLLEAVGRADEADAPDPADVHPVVGLERAARGPVRAGRRGRHVQSLDPRSRGHRQARSAAEALASRQRVASLRRSSSARAQSLITVRKL